MLVDLHNHTGWGSGDSHLDPSEMVEQARRWGVDGIAVTDHNFAWDPEKVEMLRQRHGFLVIGGVEVDTEAGHVLAFGLPGPKRWLRLPHVEQLRAEVDEAGGVMVVAHPFQDLIWTFLAPQASDEEWQKLIELRHWDLMDAIEVHNGRMGPQQRHLASELAQRLDLPTTGGSDAHRLVEVARSFTVFDDGIRDERDVVAAIKAKRCRGSDWASEGLPDKRGKELGSRPQRSGNAFPEE